MFSRKSAGQFHSAELTRRDWLRVGALNATGLTLPGLLRGRALAADSVSGTLLSGAPHATSFGRASSCIVCFLFGAPAHQDIWDLKPEAPSEVRGEFQPIASSVPGTFLGEHIPQTARLAHRYAIVRSVQHPDNTHTVAMHYMLTGQRHVQPNTNPRNQSTDFPTFGAIAQNLLPARGSLPNGISLNSPANQVSANNHIFPGFFAGLLGNTYDPLFISQDPAAPEFNPFPETEGTSAERVLGRRGLLETIDRRRDDLESTNAVRGLKDNYLRAFDLVTSREARGAFDLSQESDASRDRYGRNFFGQAMLLARRLVQARVPLVTVNWARDDAFWDTHKDNFNLLKNSLLPPFDRGFSALLDDLHDRGLLDETLVICLGEFGRTPKINSAAGRDHWAACNSVVLAGAGIQGGLILGSSDRIAAYPASSPIYPEDLAATIYHALGIDPHTTIHDRLGRPLTLCDGRPMTELFG